MNSKAVVGNRNNLADTIVLSDSTYQVFHWKDSKLISIELFVNTEKGFGEYVIGQIIDFHSNGVINKINMTNGVRLEKRDEGKQSVYQLNKLEFDENGQVINSRLMKGFKVISFYSKKK